MVVVSCRVRLGPACPACLLCDCIGCAIYVPKKHSWIFQIGFSTSWIDVSASNSGICVHKFGFSKQILELDKPLAQFWNLFTQVWFA
jgi:hypothetical protein